MIIFISTMVMLTGLLFSRALLSSGLIVFIVACLIHKNILIQLKVFFSSPFLWSMSLLFLLPLISGFWSENLLKWSQILRIKLPLLLLPVCFAGLDNFKFKDWKKISFVFLALITGSICWSLWQYFRDRESIHVSYLRAHTIETPVGNDHVRFSLLVALAIVTAFFLLIGKKNNFRKKTAFLSFVTIFFVIYLHVLAVRTGLICFYIALFTFIVWSFWNRKHRIRYVLLFVLMLLLPVISYFVFPTFKNRVSYLKYDLSLVQKKIYVQGSNDGNRFASINAGWLLQNQNPLIGVGFGDIKKEIDHIYMTHYPQMTETDKILPSNEWIIYGDGGGWPGLILFSFALIIPFFVPRLRRNIIWWLINASFFLSYLFDIGLEVQYGVFIHAFMLLWWYKWLHSEEIN